MSRNPSRPNKGFRPSIDTLEDRALPGNSVMGIFGVSNPLNILGNRTQTPASLAQTALKKTATQLAANAKSSSLASSVSKAIAGKSTSGLSIASPTTSTTLTQVQGSNSSGISLITSSSDLGILQNMASASFAAAGNSSATASAASSFISTPNSFDGGAALASAVSSATGGSATTATATQPPYDAATMQRLRDYADQDSQGFITTDSTIHGISSTQQAAANILKSQIPNLQYAVNDAYGTPSSVINTTGLLTGPQSGSPTTIATNYLKQIASFLGVSQSDLNSLTVTKSYGEKLGPSNTTLNYVYFQQQVGGIPVLGSTNVTMKGDGSIGIVTNGMIPNLASSVNTLTPTVTAADAARAVAQNLGLSVTSAIVQTQPGVGAQQKGTVSSGGFARQDINTELTLLPVGLGNTRLTWHVTTWLKNDYLFEFYVDAVNGNVMLRNSLTHFDSYRVLPVTAKAPNQGTISVVTNPADRVASPFGWHDINGIAGSDYFITRGNNVSARTERDPTTSPPTVVVPTGGSTNTYNFIADFKKDPSTYQAASAVQLFYINNILHDVSYRYGFTEQAANFQQNNYGRGSPALSHDQVLAFAQDGADVGNADNAFFATPSDGTSGEMHMFIWDLTSPQRDGVFDTGIPTHEFGHGIITREVGGGSQYLTIGAQAGALQEGGADFNSLFYTTGTVNAGNFNKATPVGTYVLGETPTGGGIRRFPYSTDHTINPLTYNDIDPTQADAPFPPGSGPVDESHNAGEIWTNTLWEMEANLVNKYGFSSNLATGTGGNNRAYQLYIAGLKLTAGLPSLLDARNGVIAAENLIYGGTDLFEVWSAFADRGFGVNAEPGVFHPLGTSNPAGPGWESAGVVEDFTIPDGLGGGGGGGGGGGPVGGNGSADALFEPNETANRAFDLGTLTGVNAIKNLAVRVVPAGTAQDRDWYKLTTTKAGTLTVNMEVSPDAGDLDVRLYRSLNGSPTALTEVGVGQGTHRVAGQSETINVAVGAGQTYYVIAQGFNNGVGNYNLNITAPA